MVVMSSVGVSHSPATVDDDAVPAPPPEATPSNLIRTPELTAASPSMMSRPSSVNTTPRQGNRKTFEEQRRLPGFRHSTTASNPRMPPTIRSPASRSTIHSLPNPKSPSKCSLLCCFYAEFDIKVGPKISFQSPENFMEQDIRLSVPQMEKLLAETFEKAAVGELPEQSSEVETRNQEAKDSAAEELSLHSIFDSCSEYIITGSELTGNIINLSTHHIHVLTRPTVIADEKYERNSLLFCVGFVLRRTEDPQPYRSVLSKLALTLRDLEVESEFLSHCRPQIQTVLAGILLSLNSEASECNMLLGKADVLNLKLFRPPSTPAMHVKNHAVPILMRRDWQVQSVRTCDIRLAQLWNNCRDLTRSLNRPFFSYRLNGIYLLIGCRSILME